MTSTGNFPPQDSSNLTEYGFTSHSTQNRSFQRHSSKPISWLGTEKTRFLQTSTFSLSDAVPCLTVLSCYFRILQESLGIFAPEDIGRLHQYEIDWPYKIAPNIHNDCTDNITVLIIKKEHRRCLMVAGLLYSTDNHNYLTYLQF